MNLKDFKQAGYWPTLLAAFLYFDIGFMAWTSLGPLMVYSGNVTDDMWQKYIEDQKPETPDDHFKVV